MSAAQFLSGAQLNSIALNEQKPDQNFNLLLQAFLLMKAKNNSAEPNNVQYLSSILNPIIRDAQAIPIRLKILVDKIIENLDVTDVQKVIQDSGWSVEDLQRGYILIVNLIITARFHSNF